MARHPYMTEGHHISTDQHGKCGRGSERGLRETGRGEGGGREGWESTGKGCKRDNHTRAHQTDDRGPHTPTNPIHTPHPCHLQHFPPFSHGHASGPYCTAHGKTAHRQTGGAKPPRTQPPPNSPGAAAQCTRSASQSRRQRGENGVPSCGRSPKLGRGEHHSGSCRAACSKPQALATNSCQLREDRGRRSYLRCPFFLGIRSRSLFRIRSEADL